MFFKIGNKRINSKVFIYFIIIFTVFMNTFIDDLHFPAAIRYLNDIFIVILLISLLFRKNIKEVVTNTNSKYVVIFIILFTIVNIVSALINLVPIQLVLWATRNTYRFFVFYLASITFLEKKDVDNIMRIMCKLQILNFALVLYQYFILGLKQDTLGGLFGHGGNAGLLIYSIIILAYSIVKYNSKVMPLYQMLFILITTVISSVLAELRIFFIIIAIILILNVLLTKFTLKKIVIITSVVILFFVSINIYSSIFPYVDLSIESFISEGTSTGGGYNLSRLNGISEINKIFFKGDAVKMLFGYGFGNCEYSSFEIFTSNFHNLYGEYHYRWFTHLWIFLETGYFGMISYIMIILSVIVQSLKMKKKVHDGSDKDYLVLSNILATIMLIMFIYNSLLKADFGYLAFFVLSIPSIIISNANKNREKKLEI